MKILITGASGFIGGSIKKHLTTQADFDVISVSLRTKEDISRLDLNDVDIVIHCGALVHQMHGADDSEYMLYNYQLTCLLADKAKQCGASKFIFISTIKVYDDNLYNVLSLSTPAGTNDPYGKSKYLAEQFLLNIATANFHPICLRLPLVYGFGVKGNFIQFLKFHAYSKIIPFKNIQSKRSMVYIDNVVAMIDALLSYSGTQKKFLISDNLEPLSLAEISTCIVHNLHKKNKVWFISFPRFLQKILKYIKPQIYNRIFENLIVDPAESFNELGFTPPYDMCDGIKSTCEEYLKCL